MKTHKNDSQRVIKFQMFQLLENWTCSFFVNISIFIPSTQNVDLTPSWILPVNISYPKSSIILNKQNSESLLRSFWKTESDYRYLIT